MAGLEMAALLPGVAVSQSFSDPSGQQLFPTEEPAVLAAVAERRAEYTTARVCARRALSELGIDPLAIVNDSAGVPLWPPGVVGSMTHCKGYRAAAVADASALAGLGIDAEPHVPMPAGVLQKVAAEGEISRLAKVSGVAVDLVLWTAKEAAYKAWFPLTRCWVPPKQLEVTLTDERRTPQLTGGTFIVQVWPVVGATAAPRLIHGGWLADASFVFAAATIPA